MRGNLAPRGRPLAAFALLAFARAALAQAPHPIPPPQRALHARAAEAEWVAIGRVTLVERGRITFRCEAALRGALPDAFQVKRSPLRPPALETGDRALLFLRGARSPYVFAGEPSEALRIPRGDAGREIERALPALVDTPKDPGRLRAIYGGWAASASPLLRSLGRAGLDALPPNPPARRPPR